MSKEKKRTGRDKKIVPIGIAPEELEILEDPKMDRLLRESIIQEADRIEDSLNNDPSLVGVGASDDLFGLIVQKLKEQGVWEEDEADELPEGGESGRGAREVSASDEKRPEEGGFEAETAQKRGPDVEKKLSGNEETGKRTPAEADPERKMAKEAALQGEDLKEVALQGKDFEKKAAKETALQGEDFGKKTAKEAALQGENFEKKAAKGDALQREGKEMDETELLSERGGTNHVEDVENSEKTDLSGGKPVDLQGLLSEKDLAALKLGREMQEKRVRRKHRRRIVLKRTGIVAAVMVIVCGMGMTSGANRRLALKAWDAVKESFGFKVSTDYADDKNRIYSELVGLEKDAVDSIKEKLGIPVIYLQYRPEKMKYMDYDILEDGSQATMMYTYQDKIFFIDMMSTKLEASNYYAMDEKAILVEKIKIKDTKSATVWETSPDQDQKTYIVEIETDTCRYILNGVISLEEMKKITGSLIFL